MASPHDDELWELVPEEGVPSPDHLRRFVAGWDRSSVHSTSAAATVV